MGIALAAEITGDWGPDQNTDSELSGTTGFNQTVWYVNGTACDSNSQCQSQFCVADYDAVGNFCAPTNYCSHDGTSYATGTKTCYGGHIKTCASGTWTTTTCSSGCTAGVCNSSSGTTCGNGVCETGETCSNCVTDCGACDAGSGGSPGGGSPGGGTSATPTPTPTPSPTPTPEKILEKTLEYNPTVEQVDSGIEGAGIIDPEKQQQAKDNTLNLDIKRSLVIEENEDGSFKSTVTVTILNNSSQTIEKSEAFEFIPKEFIENFEDIQSSQEFELVGETDEFYIIKWTYGPLAPGESASFSYWVSFELSSEVLDKSQSLFAGEKKEVIIEKLYGSITVNALFEAGGGGQQGIVVSLFKDYVKTDTKTTNSDGIVEFKELEPGDYWVSSQETSAFKAGKSETISLKAEENAALTLNLEKKPGLVVPSEKIPWDTIGLILLIAAILVIGYLFKDKLLVLFAGKKVGGLEGAVKKMDKEARRPFKKSHDARIAAAEKASETPKPKEEKKKGKTFKCDECGKEFHTRIALKAHKRHH